MRDWMSDWCGSHERVVRLADLQLLERVSLGRDDPIHPFPFPPLPGATAVDIIVALVALVGTKKLLKRVSLYAMT